MELEFDVGDWVFLRVSPWTGVVRFKGKRKLAPRYVGPYEIIERIGVAAYQLSLPTELSRIHNVFHISNLRKYIADPSHVMKTVDLEVREDLSCAEESLRIIDRKEQVLCSKKNSWVKILWRHHGLEEAIWEGETEMRNKHPVLFVSGTYPKFRGRNSLSGGEL